MLWYIGGFLTLAIILFSCQDRFSFKKRKIVSYPVIEYQADEDSVVIVAFGCFFNIASAVVSVCLWILSWVLFIPLMNVWFWEIKEKKKEKGKEKEQWLNSCFYLLASVLAVVLILAIPSVQFDLGGWIVYLYVISFSTVLGAVGLAVIVWRFGKKFFNLSKSKVKKRRVRMLLKPKKEYELPETAPRKKKDLKAFEGFLKKHQWLHDFLDKINPKYGKKSEKAYCKQCFNNGMGSTDVFCPKCHCFVDSDAGNKAYVNFVAYYKAESLARRQFVIAEDGKDVSFGDVWKKLVKAGKAIETLEKTIQTLTKKVESLESKKSPETNIEGIAQKAINKILSSQDKKKAESVDIDKIVKAVLEKIPQNSFSSREEKSVDQDTKRSKEDKEKFKKAQEKKSKKEKKSAKKKPAKQKVREIEVDF